MIKWLIPFSILLSASTPNTDNTNWSTFPDKYYEYSGVLGKIKSEQNDRVIFLTCYDYDTDKGVLLLKSDLKESKRTCKTEPSMNMR